MTIYPHPAVAAASDAPVPALDWSDSDDDGDDATPTPPDRQQRVHTVTVTDHSFKSYQAVWMWILTRRIRFAVPDRPAAPAAGGAQAQGRAGTVAPVRTRAPRAGSSPASPPGVSAKSVYRLAHLLDLSELRDQALAAFEASLTVDNAARQLFGSTADLYDDVRAAAVRSAVGHWREVQASPGMREVRARVEARELDHGGVISMALAEAFAAKAAEA